MFLKHTRKLCKLREGLADGPFQERLAQIMEHLLEEVVDQSTIVVVVLIAVRLRLPLRRQISKPELQAI